MYGNSHIKTNFQETQVDSITELVTRHFDDEVIHTYRNKNSKAEKACDTLTTRHAAVTIGSTRKLQTNVSFRFPRRRVCSAGFNQFTVAI
jgi:hypothetical protein